MKCLAIDDSHIVRLALKLVLESQGYKIEMAYDGEEALRKIRISGNFDLIVTDINLPNTDGITFLREIRKIDGYQVTPILVISAESEAEKMAEGKNAGANDWIVKPFKPNELIFTLKKIKEQCTAHNIEASQSNI